MSIASDPGAVHADPPSRPAGPEAPVVALPVPAPREATELGLPALLAAVRAAAAEDPAGSGAREAVRPAEDDRVEFVAQDLALAGESVNLRARAGRYAAIVEDGGTVDTAEIEAVLRAFRSYEPFLGARDRMLNEAAHRRLAGAAGTPRGSRVA